MAVIKKILRVPSTLHSTLASAWFALAIGSRTDMRSVLIMQYVEQVYYVELQEDHIFSRRYLPNTSNSDIGMCGCRDLN